MPHHNELAVMRCSSPGTTLAMATPFQRAYLGSTAVCCQQKEHLRVCVPTGVLESIQQHFRAPPAAVLEAWDPVKLLDSTPFDKADIYSSANISMVNQVLQQPAALHAAVSL